MCIRDREIAGLVGAATDVAKQQIAAKQVFKEFSKRVGIAGGTEAATEALQEAIGYTAAHTQENFDFNELNQRMIAGAVAGSALGGGLAVPGSAYNTGAWADVAYRYKKQTVLLPLKLDSGLNGRNRTTEEYNPLKRS